MTKIRNARSRAALHDRNRFLFVGAEISRNHLGIVTDLSRRTLGFVVFQWCAPTTLVGWWTSGLGHVVHGWLGLPFPLVGDSAIGGSIPGFAAAFVVALAVLPRRPAPSETP